MKSSKDYLDDYPLLHQAAAESNWDEVKSLLKRRRADVNDQDKDGKTVLHYAVEVSNVEIVKWLLEHGLNAKNKLELVATSCPDLGLDLAKLLADQEAYINARDKDGKTALRYAVEQNNLIAAEWLVKHGADVNVRDKYGQAALHYVVEQSKWDIAEWLVEQGADVNTKLYAKPILHYAAKESNWDVVKWLVEHGAGINVEDKVGKTVLNYAALNEPVMIEWLINQGGKITEKRAGTTPSDDLVEYGDYDDYVEYSDYDDCDDMLVVAGDTPDNE